jgi:hypothetical protein
MKRFIEGLKHYVLVLISLPLGLVMWLVYVHTVSILDPILTIVLGGGFILAMLLGLINILIILKDFIVSIFKDDKTRDERGFKKHF